MDRESVKIRLVTEDDGSMWATVEEMPGVFAAGDTLDEVRESLKEGISLYLAEDGSPAPAVHLGEFHDEANVTETHADLALA